MHNEALGTDYAAAVNCVETVLLPAFDDWLKGGTAAPSSLQTFGAIGTLDWLFGEYRADRRFTKLDPLTRRNHESGFKLVGGHVLKDGRRLGQARLTAITTAVIDALYEALLPAKDAEGNVIGERRTTVNIVARRHPGKLAPVISSAISVRPMRAAHKSGVSCGSCRRRENVSGHCLLSIGK